MINKSTSVTLDANSTKSVELEALEYLSNKNKSLQILNNNKILKSGFIKFNTTLPSSASVERLFSTALQILTPRRNRLSAKTFEQLLFLKSNSSIK